MVVCNSCICEQLIGKHMVPTNCTNCIAPVNIGFGGATRNPCLAGSRRRTSFVVFVVYICVEFVPSVVNAEEQSVLVAEKVCEFQIQIVKEIVSRNFGQTEQWFV